MSAFQKIYLFLIAIVLFGCNSDKKEVLVLFDGHSEMTDFAYSHLEEAFIKQGYTISREDLNESSDFSGKTIVFIQNDNAHLSSNEIVTNPVELKKEGFHILKNKKDVYVIGADDAGLMYGGIELAEQLASTDFEGLQSLTRNPYMEMRGTKYNIPLDARTPTYTEPSDAAQNNMIESWSMDFWKEYIDHLAEFRYNYISLWSLHPFPSLVKVPEYPDIALDDVKQYQGEWDEYYSTRTADFDSPEIMSNLVTIKEISIDEKIEFWKEVMAYGKSRNIDFYFITWNIYTNGVDGKYGIDASMSNKVTKDYYRKSIKAMYDTYTDLAGIGLTTGEHMDASAAEKEDWVWDTYGQGTVDAAEAYPDRMLRLIHRQHEAGAQDIVKKFQPLVDHPNIDFVFSFKYAKAHVYSSTVQTFHHDYVKDIEGMKTIWTMRNDDVYHYRWAAPDFVREFIENIPYDVSQGFYLGSDQYVWGREFLSKDPSSPREIELSKHWLHWMIWGQLGYDPTVSNDRFSSLINDRFGIENGAEVLDVWQHASMIYPITTGFHWGPLDFQWYIEACKSRPGPAQTESGFHDVNRFISLGTHPGTDFITIPDYVKLLTDSLEITGTSPIDVSKLLHEHSDKALTGISKIGGDADGEFGKTIHDIRIMANLGKYYAFKINAATELAMYRVGLGDIHQTNAINELKAAYMYWNKYTRFASEAYRNPLWTNRVGYVDWEKLTEEVKNDVLIAEKG